MQSVDTANPAIRQYERVFLVRNAFGSQRLWKTYTVFVVDIAFGVHESGVLVLKLIK